MAYVLICVVLALILLPVIRILPSRRQKEQMAMRRVAMAAGVAVQLTTIDDPDPRQEKYLSHTGKALAPRLKVVAWRCPRRQLPASGDWCLQRTTADKRQAGPGGNWVWSKEPDAALSSGLRTWLEAAIGDLPADVEQVEETQGRVSVYWHEREAGTEHRVLEFLKTCTALPLDKPAAEPRQ